MTKKAPPRGAGGKFLPKKLVVEGITRTPVDVNYTKPFESNIVYETTRPEESKPVEPELAKPAKQDIGVKFGHHGEALSIYVWKGNSSQETRITAPEVMTLPRGRLAERAVLKAVEAINAL